jgi:hypothetical protein
MAINVQSLPGVIFMVGTVAANTVLITDFARRKGPVPPGSSARRREPGLDP